MVQGVRPPGDDRSGRVGSGPRWTRHTTPPFDRPCTGPVRRKPIYAGHPLHGSTSGPFQSAKTKTEMSYSKCVSYLEMGKSRTWNGRACADAHGPTDADSLGGWQTLPYNSGQLDNSARRRPRGKALWLRPGRSAAQSSTVRFYSASRPRPSARTSPLITRAVLAINRPRPGTNVSQSTFTC